ncbi:MAG: GTPase Era [Candidatus Cloacimonadota bacterium]|nr:GTPase Era [Candidatus Cloacimonadota bacterium]
MSEIDNFHAGFVSIIGKPNVGKSSLMNKFIGEKLSIITPKPQTTRENVTGIYNEKSAQIVFVDTPGFLKPRYLLQEKMLKSIKSSLNNKNIVIFMSDAKIFPTNYDMQIIEIVKKLNSKIFIVINKIDTVTKDILEKHEKVIRDLGFSHLFFISVTEDFGVEGLKQRILAEMPLHPPFYPIDDIATQHIRFFVKEKIREKLFLNLQQEVPYASAVTVEIFDEFENKVKIYANIWVESKSQKAIVIGEEGRMIKSIREAAERDIHHFLQKRIILKLWVKVRQKWRKKERVLKEFGY